MVRENNQSLRRSLDGGKKTQKAGLGLRIEESRIFQSNKNDEDPFFDIDGYPKKANCCSRAISLKWGEKGTSFSKKIRYWFGGG